MIILEIKYLNEEEKSTMNMNKVDYTIHLTGSKLFDIVMYNTAKKLCQDYPGLTFDYGTTAIHVYGELNDTLYAKYQEEMFGKGDGNSAE